MDSFQFSERIIRLLSLFCSSGAVCAAYYSARPLDLQGFVPARHARTIVPSLGLSKGFAMRIVLAAMLALMISGCSSILLGNASAGDGGMTTDTRSDAQVAADNTISASIRRQLSADSVVGAYAIGIRTIDRKVTLSGTVGSFAARDRAIEIANNTDGVKDVRNQLVVNTNL